jgi:hypothetical protein
MAKVTITLRDKPDGEVDLAFDFKPAVMVNDGSATTPAQAMALRIAEALQTVKAAGVTQIAGTPAD